MINGGSGTTTIDVGTAYNNSYFGVNVNHFSAPPGGVLSQIDGLLRVNGGTGTSTLNLDNSGGTADAVSVLSGSTLDGLNPNPSIVQDFTINYAVGGTFTLQVGSGGPSTGCIAVRDQRGRARIGASGVGPAECFRRNVTKASDTYTVAFMGSPQIQSEDLTLHPNSSGLVSNTFNTPASIAVQPWSVVVQSVTLRAGSGAYPVTLGNGLGTVVLTAGESAAALQDALITAIASTNLVGSLRPTRRQRCAGRRGWQHLLRHLPGAASRVDRREVPAQCRAERDRRPARPNLNAGRNNAVSGTYTLSAGGGLVTYSLPWNAVCFRRTVGFVELARAAISSPSPPSRAASRSRTCRRTCR